MRKQESHKEIEENKNILGCFFLEGKVQTKQQSQGNKYTGSNTGKKNKAFTKRGKKAKKAKQLGRRRKEQKKRSLTPSEKLQDNSKENVKLQRYIAGGQKEAYKKIIYKAAMKQCQYQKHDLVYAKIRGYPWWPGIIGDVKLKSVESGEKKYELLVNFIGDNSYSNLAEDKIKKFTISEGDSKIKKPKKLQMSIQIASDIFNGKYTYQEWKGKDSKKGGQQSKSNKQGQKDTKGKKQVHFEDSSETEEDEGESEFEEDSEVEEFCNGSSAGKGNRKASSSASKDNQKRKRRSSVSMEEEFITKNKKRKTNKVIEDSEEDETQNKAALLNSKTLSIPATNLSTSNSSSNNSSTADNSQTPFFVANSDTKKKATANTEEIHVIETDDDEEEEAGGACRNNHFGHSTPLIQRLQDERQIANKLSDISAAALKQAQNQIEVSNSLILNHKQSIELPTDNTQMLKLAIQTSYHGNSRKNSASLTSKKDHSIIIDAATSTTKQPAGSQIIELDENKSEHEETQEQVSLVNGVTSQRLTRGGKLPTKKTKNPRLLKTLKTTPSLEEAANGADLPKMPQISPLKKKRISKTPEKEKQTGDVQINNKKFTIIKKRNLEQKQIIKSGTRCQQNTLDLDYEFKNLFPLLQSKDPEDIPVAFNILDAIIEKIKHENPQESNVEYILGSDNGKLLSCALTIIYNSWYISTISGNSQKYQEIRSQLNDLIELLQQLLIKKYFDHGNKHFDGMSEEKSNYEGDSGISFQQQQKLLQQKSHQQLAQLEDDGDSTRETPMSKHPIIQEETSKNGSIQSFDINASVKQKRKSSSQKSSSDISKLSYKSKQEQQQSQQQNQIISSNVRNTLEKSEEQTVSSFLLNTSSSFCQEMNSEGQSNVVIIKDIDFPSTPQVGGNESNKTNLELSNLTDELKVMRRKIVLKIIKSLNRILNQQALVQNYAKTIETMIRETDLSMGKKYKETCKNLITYISSSDFTTSEERIEQYITAGDPHKFSILDVKSETISQSKISSKVGLFQDTQQVNRKLSTFSTEEDNIQMSSESNGTNHKEEKKDPQQNHNTCCVNEEDDEEEIEEICNKVKEEEEENLACSQNVHSKPTYNNNTTTTTLENTIIASGSHGHENHTVQFQQNQQKQYLNYCHMNVEDNNHDNNDSNHSHEMNSKALSQSEQIVSANAESVMCKEEQDIIDGNITQTATSVLIA